MKQSDIFDPRMAQTELDEEYLELIKEHLK